MVLDYVYVYLVGDVLEVLSVIALFLPSSLISRQEGTRDLKLAGQITSLSHRYHLYPRLHHITRDQRIIVGFRG
jgi:hypothetical protein